MRWLVAILLLISFSANAGTLPNDSPGGGGGAAGPEGPEGPAGEGIDSNIAEFRPDDPGTVSPNEQALVLHQNLLFEETIHDCPTTGSGSIGVGLANLGDVSPAYAITNSDPDGCNMSFLDSASITNESGYFVLIYVKSSVGGTITLIHSATTLKFPDGANHVVSVGDAFIAYRFNNVFAIVASFTPQAKWTKYNNATSLLTATWTQTAIDELDARLDLLTNLHATLSGIDSHASSHPDLYPVWLAGTADPLGGSAPACATGEVNEAIYLNTTTREEFVCITAGTPGVWRPRSERSLALGYMLDPGIPTTSFPICARLIDQSVQLESACANANSALYGPLYITRVRICIQSAAPTTTEGLLLSIDVNGTPSGVEFLWGSSALDAAGECQDQTMTVSVPALSYAEIGIRAPYATGNCPSGASCVADTTTSFSWQVMGVRR